MTTNNSPFYVIGAGYGRTGTASFKKALEILGRGPCYHMFEVFQHKHAVQWEKIAAEPNNKELLHSVLGGSGFHSSCDFPSAAFWEEQLALYPDAKVVLTTRDPEKWYKSCTDTIFNLTQGHPSVSFGFHLILLLGIPCARMGPMTEAVITQRSFHGDWSKENTIKCFNEHNQHVIDTCPKDKLLVFEAAQGWEPLCKFLDLPVPDVPYPHENDTQEFVKQVKIFATIGNAVIVVGVLGMAATLAAGYMYFTGENSIKFKN
mmetsp:Transcript_73111/g.143412  ORF Transcript_73111/g.143412 Transcript_73111/m.143412 type:complete len:261 (+) Transcript_73111:47-829(+)